MPLSRITFSTSLIQVHTFNNTAYVSGSQETSKFYLSIGDQRSTGIVPKDKYQRNTFRVNASKKVGDVELSVNSSFFTDKTDQVGNTIGDQDRPLYWFLLNTSANIPLSSYSDWRNNKYAEPSGYYNGYYENPYYCVDANRRLDVTSRFTANVQASWDIVSWLNLTARVAANNTWGNGKNHRDAYVFNTEIKPTGSAISSFLEDTEFQISDYIGDLLLTGSWNLSDFSLKAIVGGTVMDYDYRYSSIRVNNLSIPYFYDISNGTGSPSVTANAEKDRQFGFFGDFTLGYRNFIYLNFSGRNDWTSTLAKGNNSYFYPGVGLSFVLTDAVEALKNNNILSYAKLTASNSTVYNDLSPYRINEILLQAFQFPVWHC